MDDVTPQSMRAWRLSQGLSQEQLAEKLGVTQTMIAKWETGAQPVGRGWYRWWHLVIAGLAVGTLDELTGGRVLGHRPRQRKLL